MLGFTEFTQRIYIASNETPWHFWDKAANARKQIHSPMIRFKLLGISKLTFSGEYGDVEKLLIKIDAGEQQYEIVTGYTTWFSKSFLLATSQLTPKQLAQDVLKIQPNTATNNNKVIFCRLFCNEMPVVFPKLDKTAKGKVVVDIDSYFELVNALIEEGKSLVASSQVNPMVEEAEEDSDTPPWEEVEEVRTSDNIPF